MRNGVEVADLHELLALDRSRYERLLLSRMGSTISREDAEDIVSDALLRVQARSSDQPQPGKEDAWFARIVLNQGIDFLRSRDGRKREGSTPRPAVVSLSDMDDDLHPACPSDELESLAEATERDEVGELVTRVLDALDPKDAELVKLRHLVGASASREQVAAMAGLTVGEFRWRYARAWARFVDAVELEAPTPRCRHIRQLLGEVEAGTAPAEAASEIDAHTLDCASCRVFARESYRALELIPFAPVLGAAERWWSRCGWWWERNGPEAAAGTGAAAGVGLAGLFGGGSAGMIKVVAVVCSATAITASLCAGVAEVLDDFGQTPPARAAKEPQRAAPTATATATLSAQRTATPTPTPRKRRPARTTADTSGRKQIPAGAPAGASEFRPTASTASVDPAPAPDAGGSEFAP
jgi:RNA polymerase sigma factor (sigma-70 family)